jgi:hypothetical protein
MARALQEGSTDMIGLARPLTAEPHFCADLIAGRTTTAKPNLVDDKLSTGASIAQIADIAAGRPPADLSKEDVAKAMTATLLGQVVKPPVEKQADVAQGAYAERK